MSLYFRKSALTRACHHLQAQLRTFESFTAETKYPQCIEEKRDLCIKLSGSLQNAIDLIDSSKSTVLSVLDSIEKEYLDVKKPERKEFLEEMQSIAKEISYDAILEEADQMLSALRTRLVETQCELKVSQRNMSAAMTFEAEHEAPGQTRASTGENLSAFNTTQFPAVMTGEGAATIDGPNDPLAGDLIQSEPVAAESNQQASHSLMPPRVAVPKFDGKSDFAEYWALYETMVHNNRAVNVMEKLILLKESLVGQAAMVIKGIKLVPENYQWMVNTLRKKYDNITTARARIIRRLVDLSPAKDNIGECEVIFDELRVLVHEMVSSGYNIIETHDPMWIETILQKLPRHVVEEFLKENTERDTYTVGETLDRVETIIGRFKYVSERLSSTSDRKDRDKYRDHSVQRKKTDHSPQHMHRQKNCVFCDKPNHRPYQCRIVADVSARRRKVVENNLCWKCFASDHSSNNCSRANCPRCGRAHDSSLCNQNTTAQQHTMSPRQPKPTQSQTYAHVAQQSPPVRPDRDTAPSTPYAPSNTQMTGTEMCTPLFSGHASTAAQQIANFSEQIVLMTAEGMIWNTRNESYERALFLFDTGAQASLIEEGAAEKLALSVHRSEVCSLTGIGGVSETFTSYHVDMKVLTAHGRELQFTLRTKPRLVSGFHSVILPATDVQFMEENNIYLSNSRMRGEYQVPQVLIGIDLYSSFVYENGSFQMPSGLRVTRTIFGMAAYGRGVLKRAISRDLNGQMVCNTIVVEEGKESEMIRKMFELESLGIATEEGANDEVTFRYQASYAQSIQFKDKCVTAPFPLKDNIIHLSDNRSVAFKRLVAQIKHLNAHPEQKKWYATIIEQYLRDDVIEEVERDVPNSVGTYYMPHSGVWKEHKSTPLRIVFDASSHQRGRLSLNDVLFTGASFVNKIHDIIVASREPPIILVADIQAAFTQIRIHESHRDLCRFLWLREPDKPLSTSNMVEYRWKRVPFGTTASPSMLNMVISAYLTSVSSTLANEIQRYLYVDNVFMTAWTEEEAVNKYKASKQIFAAIGMNLRSYVSNSALVNSQIAEADRAPYSLMKFLGVIYNPVTDSFSFKTDACSSVKIMRDTLRQHHSVYDPIGIGAPLLVRQKCLLRSVLEKTKDWNSPLDKETVKEWNLISKDVADAHIEIPRAVSQAVTNVTRRELWVFADASSKAMAVCAYMKLDEKSVSTLLSGKTKLAPKRRLLSIPRLELLAILLAARLAESITNALPNGVTSINVVSDSLIALSWIKSSRRLPLFIANQKDRINVIFNRLAALGHKVFLFHVTSEKNPADAGTRGVDSAQLQFTEWVRGPQWLLTDQEEVLKNINSIDLPICEDTCEPEKGVICTDSPQAQPYRRRGADMAFHAKQKQRRTRQFNDNKGKRTAIEPATYKQMRAWDIDDLTVFQSMRTS